MTRALLTPSTPKVQDSTHVAHTASADALTDIVREKYGDAARRGNPTALAQLNAGETVLDLGSGGGIDVILSARRVGPTGTAYGLDMTDDMLALARQVGFTGAEIEPTRAYRSEDARAFLEEAGIAVDEHLDDIDGKFTAAFVRATKPVTA